MQSFLLKAYVQSGATSFNKNFKPTSIHCEERRIKAQVTLPPTVRPFYSAGYALHLLAGRRARAGHETDLSEQSRAAFTSLPKRLSSPSSSASPGASLHSDPQPSPQVSAALANLHPGCERFGLDLKWECILVSAMVHLP